MQGFYYYIELLKPNLAPRIVCRTLGFVMCVYTWAVEIGGSNKDRSLHFCYSEEQEQDERGSGQGQEKISGQDDKVTLI